MGYDDYDDADYDDYDDADYDDADYADAPRRRPPKRWGLGAAFLFFDPVKVYLAFAFSHAVEYMVFVWAILRRRYAKPSKRVEQDLLRSW